MVNVEDKNPRGRAWPLHMRREASPGAHGAHLQDRRPRPAETAGSGIGTERK